jgi:hypothetical protein
MSDRNRFADIVKIVLVAGMALLPLTASAQARRGSAMEMVMQMKEDLALTEDQVGRILPIFEDELEQMRLLAANGMNSVTRARIEILQKDTAMKISRLLTRDQLERLQQKHDAKAGGLPADQGALTGDNETLVSGPRPGPAGVLTSDARPGKKKVRPDKEPEASGGLY